MLRRGHWWARRKAAMAKLYNNGVLFLESCQFFEKWRLPIPYTQISWNLGTAKCRRIQKTRSKQHYQPHQMHTKYGQQDRTESVWHFWSDFLHNYSHLGNFRCWFIFGFSIPELNTSVTSTSYFFCNITTSGVRMKPSQELDPMMIVQVHDNIFMVVQCCSLHVL